MLLCRANHCFVTVWGHSFVAQDECLACIKKEHSLADSELWRLLWCIVMPRKQFCLSSQFSEAAVLNRVSCVKTGAYKDKDLQQSLFISDGPEGVWWNDDRVRGQTAVVVVVADSSLCALVCDLQLCIVHREILFDPEWDASTEPCLTVYSCVTNQTSNYEGIYEHLCGEGSWS